MDTRSDNERPVKAASTAGNGNATATRLGPVEFEDEQSRIIRAARRAGLNTTKEVSIPPGTELNRISAAALANIATQYDCNLTARLGSLQSQSSKELSFLFLIIRSRRLKSGLTLIVKGANANDAAAELENWLGLSTPAVPPTDTFN